MHTILLQSVEVGPSSQLLVEVVVYMNYGEVAEDFVDGTLMVDNAIVVEGEVGAIAGDDSLAQVMVVKGGGSLA